MDYGKIYDRLVDKRRNEPADEGEWHHVVPRAEGGPDDKSNLVKLTYKEHVFAHQLLARIYDDLPMWCAAVAMLPAKRGKNLKLAALARKRMAQKLAGEGNPMFGKNIKDYMSDEEYERWRQKQREKGETQRGENNPMFGKSSWAKCTPEQRADRIARFRKSIMGKNKGRKFTEEQRARMRAAHQTPEYRERQRAMMLNGKSNKGKRYFTDGTRNVLTFECPEGFWRGMTKRRGDDGSAADV